MKKDLIIEAGKAYGGDNKKDYDYFVSRLFDVLKLKDGRLLAVEKEDIQTDFCFGYGWCGRTDGEDMEDADKMVKLSKTFDYFLTKNTEHLKEIIKNLQMAVAVYAVKTYCTNNKIVNFAVISSHCMDEDRERRIIEDGGTLIDFEEKTKLIKILTEKLKNLEKRCNTYWKRYGALKLNCWSYLRD